MIGSDQLSEVGVPVGELSIGRTLDVYAVDDLHSVIRLKGTVSNRVLRSAEVVTITTASGASVVVAAQSRLPVYSGQTALAKNVGANMIAVMAPNGAFRWERVDTIEAGTEAVVDLKCEGYIVAGNDPKTGLILVSGSLS